MGPVSRETGPFLCVCWHTVSRIAILGNRSVCVHLGVPIVDRPPTDTCQRWRGRPADPSWPSRGPAGPVGSACGAPRVLGGSWDVSIALKGAPGWSVLWDGLKYGPRCCRTQDALQSGATYVKRLRGASDGPYSAFGRSSGPVVERAGQEAVPLHAQQRAAMTSAGRWRVYVFSRAHTECFT